ncbi:LysR family transcriptional regulator [Oceanicola sp. D3]|uniref:LysR substrate-binding domain-containing protein n=1 Tax=Oceanicola sp. D3 TaxID=2587163 RepID=UPI00111DC3B2|nr:LysR substrate-binding domain-containing protein [Oceanicola sp. D3]QDC08946.1 LysR family transcriptional regulator [Oceanicola sp. D3]
MKKRLPSLTALRTFECAARNLSFARASKELAVTPAAVGFQIRQLEEELGGALFIRKHRAVELTEKGKTLSARLVPAFKSIHRAWNNALEPDDMTLMRVSGPAKAVHSWVMPALARAQAQMPDVRISWDISKQTRDVASGCVDLAVRWALEPEGDLHWEPALRTWFTPLVQAEAARFLFRPEDLPAQGLIGVEYMLDPGQGESAWDAWFRAMGLAPPLDFAVMCSDTASAVDTAVATGHVALAGSFLASDPLERGTLVALFDTAIMPRSRFWLVCRKGWESSAEFRWFLEAVMEEAKRIDRLAAGMRLLHPDGTPVAT